jgi:O-antigen/teichoic acid export membrane protein
MHQFFRKILTSSFVKSVAVVATGSVFAQLLALGFSPVLTRIFGPLELGALSLSVTVATFFGQLATFSYHNAIPLARKESEVTALENLCFRGAQAFATVGIFSFLVLYFFLDNELVKKRSEILIYWTVPFGIYFIAMSNVYISRLITAGEFKPASFATVIQSLLNGGLSILAGLALGSAEALIVANTLSHLGRYLVLRRARHRLHSECACDSKDMSMRDVAKIHKGFFLYKAPQEVVNALTSSMPLLILGYQFGVEIVGFYGLAMRVLAVPSSVVGQAVGQVFYPKVSKAVYEKRGAARLIVMLTIALGVLGAIPYGLVFVFGERIFEFVFGASWGRGGLYAAWLALWCWCGLMNIAAVRAIPALGLQKHYLVIEIVAFIFRGGSLLVGGAFELTALATIAVYSVVGCFINLTLIAFVVIRARKIE